MTGVLFIGLLLIWWELRRIADVLERSPSGASPAADLPQAREDQDQ